MAIEFRCTGCNKLLRVAEETAGKKARCPECGAVLNIPETDGPRAPVEAFPDVAGAAHAGGGNPFLSEPVETGNPFQSPRTDNVDPTTGTGTQYGRYSDRHLASRLTRLGAVIVDGLLYGAVMIPLLVVMFGTIAANDGKDPEGAMLAVFAVVGVVSGLGLLALVVYQWYLISTYGHSLGKKWLGIRIILEAERTPPGFVKGVILRMWVPQLIGSIPIIGPLFGIADPLMIFNEQRRTLHDMIAGTIVVEG